MERKELFTFFISFDEKASYINTDDICEVIQVGIVFGTIWSIGLFYIRQRSKCDLLIARGKSL